jgi:hypothetical protein
MMVAIKHHPERQSMSSSPTDGPIKPLCFVIGPIGGNGSDVRKHADFLLHGIIRPVLEAADFGYIVKRADEDADPGMINDRVITDILDADLVVADLTGLNPNAFYELGIRHSAEKPVIHIAGSGTPLPFDNAGHRTIIVDVSDWRSIEAARSALAAAANKVSVPGYQVSNPITQANASAKMRDSADPRDRVIADLQSRLQSLEDGLARTQQRATAAAGLLQAVRDSSLARPVFPRPNVFAPEARKYVDQPAGILSSAFYPVASTALEPAAFVSHQEADGIANQENDTLPAG